MTVKLPPSHTQGNLFDLQPDKVLTTPGESRTRYGKVVEEILIEILRLQDIPNSGSHDVVFDAFGHGHFVEIKSCRAGSKVPVYEWRRSKDRDCGVPLVYAIAEHRCTFCKTLGEVWSKMCKTVQNVYIVPAWCIDLLAATEPLKRIVAEGTGGARMGYSRSGYCDGYRNVPLRRISNLTYHFPMTSDAVLFGHSVSVEVLFHRSLDPWPV